MKILAVDNEQPALNVLSRAIKEAVPGAELRQFLSPAEALAEIRENAFSPDVAFLDIEIPEMSGLELAKAIKTCCPRINVVFVTGFSKYAFDAMKQRPSGYVMKPVTGEKILTELQNLRNPPARTVEPKPIRIQCFGNFELFVNEQAVSFHRARSKELLAYLVDRRGASCSATELASVLWDDGFFDRSRQKQLAVIRSDLIRTLDEAGAKKIIVKSRNSLSVNPDLFDCDYYLALEGDSVSINKFAGEYMVPYAWAEFTTSVMIEKYGSKRPGETG